MKTMIWPSEARISASTAFSRSSNSPRYFVPATSEPTSSAHTRFPARPAGTSPEVIRWARPSTIAVLPTPGSPIRTGLFFVRLESTWMTRRTSWSRPMTGSSLPRSAASVRSRPNFGERLVRALGVGRRHALPAAHLRDRLQDRGPVELGAGREREQQVLDGHVLVLQRLGLGEGLLERLAGRAARRRLHVRALHARQRGEPGLDRVADRRRMEPGLLEDARGNARLLRQEREQQMVRGELGVAAGDGVALSRCEGLLGLYGEFREVHIAGGVGG